jgi:serine protease inhibitor
MTANWAKLKDLRRVRTRFCAMVAVLVTIGAHAPVQAQQGDVAVVVAGNNRFAFDMYHRLRVSETVAEDHGNLIFSPYSISTAVGMVYAGARGRTAQEIADVFHFGLPQDRLHPAYGSLIGDLNGAHRTGYQLSVANRLWGQNGFPMQQPFLDITREHYGAELGRLDFVRDAENSRKTINRWVEEQTNDRIKDLIPSGAIRPDTRLVLTNAIYFNGDWKHAFSKDATQDRPFAVNATEQIRAPTMFQNGRFRHADGGDFQVLELPYKGDQLSMLIVLPKAGGRASDLAVGGGLPVGEIDFTGPLVSLTPADALKIKLMEGSSETIVGELAPFAAIPPNGFAPGPVGIDALAELEAGLSADMLQAAIDNLAFRDVNVYLPKFKLETGVKLGDTLADMGMPTAFSNAADFLDIAEQPLKISEVRHKAFIELDEEGTEAAAATSIEMVAITTSIHYPPPPILFNADHPFHFLIRDNLSGSTLFMGRVARPEGAIVAIPEPSSVMLLLVVCTFAGFVFRGRRRGQHRGPAARYGQAA